MEPFFGFFKDQTFYVIVIKKTEPYPVKLSKMMEYVEREKIQALPLSNSEMEEELERSKKLFEERDL